MKVSMEFPSLWLSLIELCHIGGTLVLAIVVGLVNYDIVARNLFLHPFLGLEEIRYGEQASFTFFP